MSSRRDTPKNFSPKSPPNSPNPEPATNDDELKGVFINYYAVKVSKSTKLLLLILFFSVKCTNMSGRRVNELYMHAPADVDFTRTNYQ